MSDFQDIEIGNFNLVGNQSRIVLGTENQYGITYALSDGTIPNLTGYEAAFTIYKYIKNKKTQLLSFTASDGEIIMSDGSTDPDGANIRIVLSKSKISTLPASSEYYYDLFIKDSTDTNGKYLIEGVVDVRPLGSQIVTSS